MKNSNAISRSKRIVFTSGMTCRTGVNLDCPLCRKPILRKLEHWLRPMPSFTGEANGMGSRQRRSSFLGPRFTTQRWVCYTEPIKYDLEISADGSFLGETSRTHIAAKSCSVPLCSGMFDRRLAQNLLLLCFSQHDLQ